MRARTRSAEPPSRSRVQGGTPTLGGTLTATTDASGVATFADLSITTAGTYHLEAVSSGMSAVSNSFQISAATSAVVILAFEGDGQSAAVGTAYGGPLKARVEDPYHNPIANASVTFAAPTSGASVTFSGSATVTSGADGVAISPAMTANSQTGTFQVTATTAAASGPALFNLTNVPGSANKLAFVQQPVDTVAGATITPAVTVQVQDSAGNAVHTAGILVTLQANAIVQRLKQLSGTATQSTDANGLATFANLSISPGRQLYVAGQLHRFEFGHQQSIQDHGRDGGDDPGDRRHAAEHRHSDTLRPAAASHGTGCEQ